jgi:phage gp29-like protein
VHEIVWKVAASEGQGVRATLRYVPLYFFANTAGRLGYIGPEGAGVDGLPLNDAEWMTTTGDSALMKAASICYLFKRLSLQDWLNFSEKFGIPGVHGKTNAAKGTAEFQDFVDALDRFASDWVTATNQGAEIALIEVKQNGDGPFAPMVERMDRRLAALVLGSDLSTLSRENSVGANPQEAESDQLLEDDCEMISETLQTQLIRPLIRFVHGTDEPLAYVQLQPPTDADTEQEIKVDQFLLDNGGELDAAETFERYDRTPAKTMKAGAVLKKAAPTPTADGAQNGRGAQATAENDAALGADSTLLQKAMARALGVVPQWLAPIKRELDTLQAKAGDGISDAELLDFVESSALRLPELFAELDIAALADELEAATGTAVINGVTTALRKKAELKKAA